MKKILVVDDTYIWRMTAEKVLKDKYLVLTADSGKNCLLTITNESVDLILLDVEMPDMSGIETLTKIRSLSGYEDIPVIMVTGNNDRESVVSAAELLISGYLTKPYMPADLLSRVDKVFA